MRTKTYLDLPLQITTIDRLIKDKMKLGIVELEIYPEDFKDEVMILMREITITMWEINITTRTHV